MGLGRPQVRVYLNTLMAASVLLVVDATNILYRSYHALARSGLTHAGRPVWAVHGLLTSLARWIELTSADSLVLAFDSPGGCPPRRALLPTYKQTRSAPPPDLAYQLEWARAVASGVDLYAWAQENWEADDGVASAVAASAPEQVVAVVSSDRDVYRLLSDRVYLLHPDGTTLTASDFTDRFGITPQQYPAVAALRGEPSDNLPGVTGVGAKTAATLVARFGSLSAVFAASDEDLRSVVGPKTLQALRRDEAQAALSARVANLNDSLAVDLERAYLAHVDTASVARYLASVGLPRAGESLSRALASSPCPF